MVNHLLKRTGARLILLAAFIGSTMSAPVLADQEASLPKGLDFPCIQYKLRNGLQVIISEDDSLPLVSVVVAYGVGPFREQPGKSGLAYLMENLMFQGSENVSPMQHINFIQRIGGEFNANTTFDKTFFYETIPSNQLGLALWLESDRMASLIITGSNVEKAKNMLLEECRQQKAGEPYMESSFLFDKALFPDFVYGHPLIGIEEELSTITEDDVRAFYKTFYIPQNAVLSISGNINVVKAKELIARYFENIPRGNDLSEPAEPAPAIRPAVETRMKDSLARSPAFHCGWRVGRLLGGEYYALKLMDILLFRGKSSRLYKRVIKKDKLALYLSGGIDERRKQIAFKVFAISNNPIMADLCQKAVISEINKLKTNLVSDSEMTKAKFLFKADYLSRLSTSLQRAVFLSETYLSGIRFEDLPRQFESVLRVTPYTIIGLANKLFTLENTAVLNIETK